MILLAAVLLGASLTQLALLRFGSWGAAALVLLRLQWAADTLRACWWPSYVSLHPHFMRPDVLFVEATLKALPQAVLQLYLGFHAGL